MDDQRFELKIQEEEDDFSKSEESKMRMILNKGWALGKKIVITGMAISSAPIVLPPLVIFSSIGFAVAVPFGFVFVSYAFTEKLMSKLLSRPLNPPSLLEYKIYNGDYVEEKDFEVDSFREEIMDDDQEEEKFREDTKQALEIRIELIGDEKEDEGYVVELNEDKPVEDVNGGMEEEGRESLYYVEEEEKPGEDKNGFIEEERVDGAYFDNYVEEEEKPGEEVSGLIEEERADGTYFDNFVEEEETPGEDMHGIMEQDRADGTYFVTNVEVEEKPMEVILGKIEEDELVTRRREDVGDEECANIVIEFEESGVNENVGNIEEEKEETRPVIETEGVVEESRDQENVVMPVVKSVLGMEGEKREESGETAIPTSSSSLPRRKGRKKKGKKGRQHVKENAENVEEEKRLVREAKGGLEDSRDEEPLDQRIAMDNVEVQKAEEIGGGQNVSGMATENYIVGKELPSLQVEKVGVVEEKIVNDVTQDEADTEPHYVSLEQVSTVKEPTTLNSRKEMAESAGHTLSSEISKSKFNKEAHEQKGIILSKEIFYNEEKIWEQINVMRKIVGYKAVLQSTCIDELKALYVFTGVEPPVAFKVPSDLAEINHKLHLLMSIIGVK